MNTLLKCVLFGLVLSVTGCATQNRQQLTKDEWKTVTRHTFPGVTKDQATIAAERVLQLADGDDFAIVRDQDGLTAARNWSIYFVLGFVMGTDYWNVRVKQDDLGAHVSFAVGSQAQPSQIRAPARHPLDERPTVMGTMPEGTAIYDLFWSRMAYLLGQRDTWMSCAESDERVKAGKAWGMNEALCNSFNVKDETPEGPMVSVQDATRTSAR
ncbi:hypothetical protein [Zoogloea sp.]|uniref:hypothetical protein n=1 Tax=Zoogloea sp. TaxID=49181 RepID=UPI002639FA4E|nr:hypothetical protein [Zoogloea sp.]